MWQLAIYKNKDHIIIKELKIIKGILCTLMLNRVSITSTLFEMEGVIPRMDVKLLPD